MSYGVHWVKLIELHIKGGKTMSYSILFYLATGNILSSYQFYSGTKIIVRPSRWFKNVCAPENSEFQSSEISGHGLWILNFLVYHEVLSKSKICMPLVKTCISFVLFNYRQHIFLLISVLTEKVELLVNLCLFSFRKEETSQALSSVSILQNTVEKTRNIKKSR